jgi:hypothetical protein
MICSDCGNKCTCDIHHYINTGYKRNKLMAEPITAEITRLRRVYEAGRSLLRYNGIDKIRVEAAMKELDDAIDDVKLFDSGTEDL